MIYSNKLLLLSMRKIRRESQVNLQNEIVTCCELLVLFFVPADVQCGINLKVQKGLCSKHLQSRSK